jgi:integrase
VPKLTKRTVDAAPIKKQPYFIWCSELPGFGVRVFPSRKRVYYADYRNKSGGRKRMSIGSHGKLTTEEARKLAIVTLGDVIKGEDPALDRSTRRKSLTVSALCENYVAAAEGGLIMGKRNLPKKQSTLYSDRGRIERHIKPLLGARLVRDLAQSDLNRFVRDVTIGKTARVIMTRNKRGKAVVEGGAGTAARTAGLLGGILSYAVSEGIIPFNPARGVRRQADGARTRRLDSEEYWSLGRALKAAQDDGDVEAGLMGIWLLALTGCRRGEIELLKWTEVDVASSCFRLSDSKEGASVRPIGSAAFDVISRVKRRKDCLFVLPATRSTGSYGGMARAIGRIMERAELTDVTAHTLRHSYASIAGDLGFSDSTIETLIGHVAGTVTSKYIHRLDTVLVAAADRVAQTIVGFMSRDH